MTALLNLSALVGMVGFSDIGIADELDFPLEPADTSSPKATLQSFLSLGYEGYLVSMETGRSADSREKRDAIVRKALSCLDVSQIPPAVRRSVAKESAVLLKEVLDRIELPSESAWPDLVTNPEVTKWRIPHTEIVIEKMKNGPREGEFLFSPGTVARVPEFYRLIKNRPYVDRATVTPDFYLIFMSEPGWMIPRGWILGLPSGFHHRVMGQAIWQWVGLMGGMTLAALLMVTIYATGRHLSNQLRSGFVRYIISLFLPISAMLVPVGTRYLVMEQLQIYGTLSVWISLGLDVVFLVALVWFIMSLGSRLAEAVIATPWVAPGGLDAQMTRLICRVLSIMAAVVVMLKGGSHLGIPLATLLTGASISGLAIALAAQDSLRSIIGSMMIMLDKPYRVGEQIVAKGFEGVVVEIGLRSTRMRLQNGHKASIPNEEMARASIENISLRPHSHNAFTVELPFDTEPGKTCRALEILRDLLNNHEAMSVDYPARVCLRDGNTNSIGIFVDYWYDSTDELAFLEFGKRIQREIEDRFTSEGILFSISPRAIDSQANNSPGKSGDLHHFAPKERAPVSRLLQEKLVESPANATRDDPYRGG